jgi:L-ascorbate metabolism protein UlaG (beta-lactamase superfamily)
MVLALSEITGSSPGQVKPEIMKLVFVASQLSTQREQERAKTGWLGIRIMHPRRVTYLRMDTCFQ